MKNASIGSATFPMYESTSVNTFGEVACILSKVPNLECRCSAGISLKELWWASLGFHLVVFSLISSTRSYLTVCLISYYVSSIEMIAKMVT